MTKIGFDQGIASSYELDIYEHVPVLNPNLFGVSGSEFDPKSYFITSGDAINKTKFLIQELDTYIASIQDDHGRWQQTAQQALTGAHKMLEYLLIARGPSIFLETEHVDHKLLVVPKDPRRRDEGKN